MAARSGVCGVVISSVLLFCILAFAFPLSLMSLHEILLSLSFPLLASLADARRHASGAPAGCLLRGRQGELVAAVDIPDVRKVLDTDRDFAVGAGGAVAELAERAVGSLPATGHVPPLDGRARDQRGRRRLAAGPAASAGRTEPAVRLHSVGVFSSSWRFPLLEVRLHTCRIEVTGEFPAQVSHHVGTRFAILARRLSGTFHRYLAPVLFMRAQDPVVSQSVHLVLLCSLPARGPLAGRPGSRYLRFLSRFLRSPAYLSSFHFVSPSDGNFPRSSPAPSSPGGTPPLPAGSLRGAAGPSRSQSNYASCSSPFVGMSRVGVVGAHRRTCEQHVGHIADTDLPIRRPVPSLSLCLALTCRPLPFDRRAAPRRSGRRSGRPPPPASWPPR